MLSHILQHTQTRETLVPTGQQRLAPPAHHWTFNMGIYFRHQMSQQIKRRGLGGVPCLCSALQFSAVAQILIQMLTFVLYLDDA